MKVKKWTYSEIEKMSSNEYKMFNSCLRTGSIRLLGVMYKKFYKISSDITGIIIEYE